MHNQYDMLYIMMWFCEGGGVCLIFEASDWSDLSLADWLGDVYIVQLAYTDQVPG